jgi:hypothetical protein
MYSLIPKRNFRKINNKHLQTEYRAKFSFDQSNLLVYIKNSFDYPNKVQLKHFRKKNLLYVMKKLLRDAVAQLALIFIIDWFGYAYDWWSIKGYNHIYYWWSIKGYDHIYWYILRSHYSILI